MLKGTSTTEPTQTDAVGAGPTTGLPTVRAHPIRRIDDYCIDLHYLLQECLDHVPRGAG